MTPARYLLRSLRHYRFAYLGVLAGAVLGATVLLGALFAGDSVAASLKRISELRTGRATHVLTAGDRFFRQALGAEFATAAQARVAPVTFARGTAAHATSRAVANQVQLLGVTDAFWQLAPEPAHVALDPATHTIAVNDTLARRLAVAVGDTLIVRLQRPGVLGGNAPIAGAESAGQSIRCKVATIVDDAAFGRFSLDATQVPSPSVFLPIGVLQEALAHNEHANLLLIDSTRAPAELAQSLAAAVKLADYGLALKWLEAAATFELGSDRVFIEPDIAEAVTRALPTAQPVLSYLVNEFRVGDRATPYSIGTATTHEAAPFLPPNLGPREIVLNDWLADDLQARAGDELRLTFFQAGAAGALVEQTQTMRIHSIVPLQGLAADRGWMPAFPGISDVADTSDWDPGLPLDLKRIRDKDEKYWDDYRGAPKAFMSITAGHELWSTRWGNCTALRIPFERTRATELEATILRALRPEMNQLQLRPFRASASEAAKSPVDFGGLFIGMSFFLIAAALGLVAMLFQFVLLQRNREDALLGAVGLSARKLLRWRLAEGIAILVLASAAAVPLATLYTRGILRFLESIWAGQAAGATFVFAAQPMSIVIGCGAFLLLSLLAIWFAIRKQTRRALSIRLAAHAEESAGSPKIRRSSRIIAIVATVIAAGAIGLSGRGMPAQGAFYLAGFALLAGGIAVCRSWMAGSSPARERRESSVPPLTRRATREIAASDFGPSYLGALNVKARRSRSLTVVGLIATAVFMVLSVASFRKHVGNDWLERRSGTGGFAFWMETTSPLNPARDGQSQGFEAFAPHASALGEIVPLRAGAGDNANCFNLNTTSQPKLLAVDSAKLAARGAFPLKVMTDGDGEGAAGWDILGPRPSSVASESDRGRSRSQATDPIPAFVDETTLLWALKRKVGDVLAYTDENGRQFDVQIAGTIRDSIFQGYLIIDERLFLEKFPSHAGYSAFLIDVRNPATPTDLATLRTRLESSSRDAGGRVELTRDVLAAFHQIENTYIAIFNVLGSLGVILGSLGLAIVVARNLRERRGEFAVMSAIGIPRGVMARMVFAEFSRLVVWGIVIGAAASAIAVWPNVTTLPPTSTFMLVGTLLAGIVALNLASGWAIFRWSVRDLRPGMEQAAA